MTIKVKDVLDVLTDGGVPRERTVDKLEFGDVNMVVKGIAVTFLATQNVIETAKKLGANLIITHEGIFYSHWDKRKMLNSDPVYIKKCRTIEESGIAIFRYHDFIHDHMPDGIMEGLLEILKWKEFEIKSEPVASVIEIPVMPLEKVIAYLKKSLDIQYVRYIGDLSMPCRRIGVLVGYRGSGDLVINFIQQEDPDLVIYGEGPEWETPEYIRDSIQQGKRLSLIVLGHAESEKAGMKYLADRLQDKFSDIPVYFIEDKPVFNIL